MSVSSFETHNVYTTLRELGLSQSEIEIYLLSLEIGPSSIEALAKRLDCSRPNVYKRIVGLKKHGLVGSADTKKKRRMFTIAPPTVLLEKLKEKGDLFHELDRDLQSSMRDLLALFNRGRAPTRMALVQGSRQLKLLSNRLLEEETKERRHYGSIKKVLLDVLTPRGYEESVKRRARREVRAKALLPLDDLPQLPPRDDQKELREVRVPPASKPFPGTLELFSTTLVYWYPAELRSALVIEDGHVIETVSSMFDSLWTCSSPIDLKRATGN